MHKISILRIKELAKQNFCFIILYVPKYWIKKMWHIYTMEYYATINKDEFMSFVGTWKKLETIILSKLTQEQKIKHCPCSHS